MHFEANPLRIIMQKENSFKKCDNSVTIGQRSLLCWFEYKIEF